MRLILETIKALFRGLENRYSASITGLTKKINAVKREGDNTRRDLSAIRPKLQKVEQKVKQVEQEAITVVYNEIKIPDGFGSGKFMTYGNGTYVALGSESLAVSRDCINWTGVPCPYTGKYGSKHLRYVNGVFVFYVYSTGSLNEHRVFKSVDGVNWQPIQIDTSIIEVVSVTSAGGKFLCLARSLTASEWYVYTSSDCITWDKSQGFGKSISDLTSASFAASDTRIVVALDNSGILYYSDDGITWHDTTTSVSVWAHLTYVNGMFMNGNYSHYQYSRDGLDWVEVDLPSESFFNDVCYANGLYIMSNSSRNKLLYSYDGIEWKLGAKGYLCSLDNMIYDGERFVGVYRGNPCCVVWTKDGREVSNRHARLVSSTGEDLTEDLKIGFNMR